MKPTLPKSLAYWSVQPLNLFHHAWRAGDSMLATQTHTYALWFLRSGRVHVDNGEQHWQVNAGQVMLLPPLRQRALSVSTGARVSRGSSHLPACHLPAAETATLST